MKRDAPCKGCPDRNEYCHAKCDTYKEWSENHRKAKERDRASREADSRIIQSQYAKKIKKGKKGKTERK